MADAPVPSLARAREQKISELSDFFANDDLSLEDLERRIERVYKASSVTELEAITADLTLAIRPEQRTRGASERPLPARAALASPRGAMELGAGRVLAIMSSTRRVGRWLVPRKLDVVGIMTDTRIDLTQASLPAGIVELDLRLIMASFKLVVTPNMRVVSEVHSIMSNVRSRAHELGPEGADDSGSPIIRLTGYAVMTDVNVTVRRREDPVFDDDD